MTKHKDKTKVNHSFLLALNCLIGLVLVITMLLQGTDIALLNPKGLIAQEELSLMVFSVMVMLVIAVPTIFLFYFFAWKYRETNNKATYDPNGRHGKLFIFNLWAFPTIIMLVLIPAMWIRTHQLEPKKPIASDEKQLTIQVVAMRWKWLFIYPEQKIATVNYVQIPTDTPVQFELTADEVSMSSFWIPHLGGMLYAMTGHVNKLNLMATTSGEYPGSSAEINGAGFAGMKFVANATSKETYNNWVRDVQSKSGVLDSTEYEKLLVPSENNQAALYNLADTSLYDKVAMKYSSSHEHQPARQPAEYDYKNHTERQ